MMVNDKIQLVHLERQATVYLRQSTLKQVYEHRESTARQYALKDRALALGWPVEKIDVIDEDLGHSGTTAEGRTGFQRLAEDVAQGRVGAIFATEVSRLARSCADWHQLLDLCGLADVIIADEQACYTPSDYNDRLLLGLKGQMSEAEIHWMRLRLQGGKLSKARRGELYGRLPPGYVLDAATARLRLDSDEQVQRAVRLIFERFRIDGSMGGVVRYFAGRGLMMPARDCTTQLVRFIAPNSSSVRSFLKNPTFTGAYVYGRSERRAGLVGGKLVRRMVTHGEPQAWKICLRDHHPAYISWDEYMANQKKLIENRTNHRTVDQRGAAREGSALLQGLALCGRCGSRMHVRYQGKHGQAQYYCQDLDPKTAKMRICFNVSATRIDQAMTKLLLEAVKPAEIEIGLAVMHEVEHQAAEVERQWTLRLDRARYEAHLAERRYKAVDPDNRVVARSLEREWNDKLGEVERIEREHEEALRRDKLVLGDEDRVRIMSLAKDLPRVWHAETTTHVERKNLVRMLVQEVALSPVEVPSRLTKVRVLWRTGTVSTLTVERPQKTAWGLPSPELRQVIADLFAAGKTDEEIAAEVEVRGLRPVRRWRWGARSVCYLRWQYGLHRTAQRPAVLKRADGLLSLRGVAARLNVPERAVRYWLEARLLAPVEGCRGRRFWFNLDPATMQRLEAAAARATSRIPRRSSTRKEKAL
jgi:DNA invertase Pin-like site-specific DNA recombinase